MSIGRRLCEVKFAAGHHDSVILLLEDVCYNLRDVLGSLHPATVESERLRARLYTQCGKHADAMDVHAYLLR